MAGLARRAVEHDLPAPLARPRAHVDQPVGGQHHRRVVLDHHQGVAGIAQPVHGLHDAVHVARMQADAGLVQHEQGVHQRGAERGGEVDALHLATAEGAALAVQREVAQAHVAQVADAGAHLVEQQLQRFIVQDVRQAQGVEEHPQPVDRQEHQVVQAQARQGLHLGARPGRAHRHIALGRRQHRVGIGARAQAPQQGFQLQPGAAATGAGRVAAVLGQQHPDVHLVGLALQVLEEAAHAVPLLVPVAGPVGRAFQHPFVLGRGELAPGGVARNAGLAGVLHQVVLAFFPGRRLQRLDGAIAQGLAVVGNHQAEVHPDHPAKAAAGFAGAVGRVEAEQGRLRLAVAAVALRAVQAGGVAPELVLPLRLGAIRRRRLAGRQQVQRIHRHPAAAALEAQLDGFHHPHPLGVAQAQAVGHHVQHLLVVHHPLGLHPAEAAGLQPLGQLLGGGVGRQLHREAQHQARVATGSGALLQVLVDGFRRVVAHRQGRVLVEQLGRPGVTAASGGRSARSSCRRWSGWCAPGWSGRWRWPAARRPPCPPPAGPCGPGTAGRRR